MANGPEPTILVVEDNGALRRLVMRILESGGFRVLDAASGAEGLAVFQEHAASIALAIIDMVMPGMSGLDLAAELERQRPGMKIVYTSGHVSSVAMESISQRSPERVLFKPFEAGELLDRVVRVLGSEKPLEPARAAAISAIAKSEFAWERLIEASDPVGPAAVEVLGYKDTGAAFAVAAAHSAALRSAQLPYAFRATVDGGFPFGLFVGPGNVTQARNLIEQVGLGVDVGQPA